MAASNFGACLALTLKYEGGLSTIRSDPGNWTGGKVGKGVLKGTKYGIAASSHPTLDIRNLTVDQAGAIYRKEYWNGIRGDDLPPGVDAVTFDYGVNSGNSRAAKALQKVVGAAQDGAIGGRTIAAVAAMPSGKVVTGVCDARLAFLHSLSSWARFGKGWASRVGDIRARAVVMATGSVAAAAADADRLDKTADTRAKQAVGSAAATTIAGGEAIQATPDLASLDWGFLVAAGVFAAVAIGVVIVLASRAHLLSQAAKAARAAASEIAAKR